MEEYILKIMFISLGCDKNLVDTEYMLGILKDKGFEFTDDEMEAQVIVINTCCFIHDAKQESINTIIEMAEHKQDACCKVLIVTGCLAQRYQDEILKELPEVDAIIGTSSYDKIAEVVLSKLFNNDLLSKEDLLFKNSLQLSNDLLLNKNNVLENVNRLVEVSSDRIITTGGYYEYLKIAEGCDKHCTYCIIPKIRGSYRSYRMEYLIKEAQMLSKNGVKELILVAQETTMYGVDLYGEKSLSKLLYKLSAIDGIEWIRILYCYPEEIDKELIDAIKNIPKVVKYLDMPIQHASDTILKKMGRRTSKQELIAIIDQLREEIPDIALRTTLITGFPGETKKEHEELLDFVNDMEFDRLGVFTYSAEEDTPAAKMENQISETVKEQRRDELMALQQEISLDKSSQLIGEVLSCIVEGKMIDDDVYVARSYKDAPNVDGYVFIHTDENLLSGDMVKVKIESAYEYDLMGSLVHE